MTDEDDLEYVQAILTGAKLNVERVPESSEKRCDLRAWGDATLYLIEVKGLHDDKAMRPTLGLGEIYKSARPLSSSHGARRHAQKAEQQLRTTASATASEIRIVVFLARTTLGASLTAGQIRGELYGEGLIMHGDGAGGNVSKRCLYFRKGVFVTCKDIDAALVVGHNEDMALYLNDHSPRLQMARESGLSRCFDEHGALNSAASLEKRGFLVADCDIPREDEESVLDYVKRKYGLGFCIAIELTEHSAAIAVPHRK